MEQRRYSQSWLNNKNQPVLVHLNQLCLFLGNSMEQIAQIKQTFGQNGYDVSNAIVYSFWFN
jgi:hypothetical protein